MHFSKKLFHNVVQTSHLLSFSGYVAYVLGLLQLLIICTLTKVKVGRLEGVCILTSKFITRIIFRIFSGLLTEKFIGSQ